MTGPTNDEQRRPRGRPLVLEASSPRRRLKLKVRGGARAGALVLPVRRTAKVKATVQRPVEPPPPRQPGEGVVRTIPRRKPVSAGIKFSTPPRASAPRFKAGFLHTCVRTLVWLTAIAYFLGGSLKDKLIGNSSQKRRAERLLRAFERAGGTMVKIGQQLAMRIDLLPYEYCLELSKLLDSVPAFPTAQAISAIERTLGKPLDEVFEAFDPKPIGSASVACVYQAVLKTGEKVAVKVRRPGIGNVFAADLRAMRWLTRLVEGLTILRPGMTRHVVREFGDTLMEELDFRKEARFQELFRRRARKQRISKDHFFTAPKVYFDYSGSDVITQEFVSGIWLWEILAGVEQEEPAALARMKEFNIEPKLVAQRMLWVNNWGLLSNVLFHCDPHPANIVVRENNEIVFIDFGACGTTNHRKRRLWRDLYRAQSRKDIQAMGKASIAIIEPLPHIDYNEFEQEVENVFYNSQIAIWSKHSAWYERTTASIWFGFFDLCKKYMIPINLDTVRSFRATLLYDTLALRLDPKLDLYKEYRRFSRMDARRVRKKSRRQLRRRLDRGLSKNNYLELRLLMKTSQRALERLNAFLDKPGLNFNYMMEKGAFAVVTGIQLVAFAGGVVGLVGTAAWLRGAWVGNGATFGESLSQVLGNGFMQFGLAAIAVLGIRRLMYRLNDAKI